MCCIPTEGSSLYSKQTGNVTTVFLGLGPGSWNLLPALTCQPANFRNSAPTLFAKKQAERGTERSPHPSGPCNNLSLPENHHTRPTHQCSAQPTNTPPRIASPQAPPINSLLLFAVHTPPWPRVSPSAQGWARRDWATQWQTGRCRAADHGIACRTTCRWLRRTGQRSSRLCRRRVAS